MSRYQQLGNLLTGMMGQHPSRVAAFLDTLDDASAARLMEAAEAGDTRPILKAMSEQTWGTAPGRPAPMPQEPTGIRGPMSFEDRILRDPEIRRSIEAAGGQVPAGGAEGILEAYRGTFNPGKRGRPKNAADAIRELAKPADQVAAESIAGQFDRAARPDNPQARSRALKFARESYPAEYDIDAEDLMSPDLLGGLTPQYRRLLQELEKNDWLGFDYPSQAVSSVLEYGDAPSRWDMTPELLEARDAMIFAHGKRPAAAPPSPARHLELPLSSGEQEAYQRLADGRSVVRRGEVPEDAYADMVTEDLNRQPFIRQDSSPAKPSSIADDLTFDEVPPRPSTPKPPKNKFPVGAAAAAAGGAVGVGLMLKGRQRDLVESGNPADLRDAPVSADFMADTMGGLSERDLITPVAMPKPEPVDYSMQARKMIDQLNAMRRAAGGEVPEARQMMQEINRLIEMGNEQRRAPSYSYPKADRARDPYQQARNLINQVNNMYRAGYEPGSPEVERIMAEVRRLQAEGDAIRNRRAG